MDDQGIVNDELRAVDIPFKVTESVKRCKMPNHELEWLMNHLNKNKIRAIIPELRILYQNDKVFQKFVNCKWPQGNIELKIRRLRDIIAKKRATDS